MSMLGPWRRISPESRSVKGMGGIGSGELDGCTHVMHDRSRRIIDPVRKGQSGRGKGEDKRPDKQTRPPVSLFRQRGPTNDGPIRGQSLFFFRFHQPTKNKVKTKPEGLS